MKKQKLPSSLVKLAFVAAAVVSAAGFSTAHAANGTWNVDSGGGWQIPGNWLGGTIAGGANTDVATFNRDITGAWIITLDSATTTTLNQLVFGDTNTGTAGTWIINPGAPAGTLTLAGTSPTITVNSGASATIAAGLLGTSGLTKNGAGSLSLSGANALSGAMVISGGGGLNWNASNSSNMTNLQIDAGSSLNIGSGGSLAFTGTNIFIGRGSAGSLILNGGSVSFSNAQEIGNRSTTGTVTINSGTYTSTTTTYVAQTTAVGGGVARSTTGNFNVLGGSANLNALTLGGSNNNTNELEVFNANLTVSGTGTLTTTGTINVARGNRVTAVANISGGTVNTLGFNILPNGAGTAANSSATINISGGVVNIGASGIYREQTTETSSYAINLSGGTLAASANWSSALDMTLSNTNGGVTFKASNAADQARNITLSGNLSGDGTLSKSGDGILSLSGNNTYTGGTVISAGTLSLGSSNALGGNGVIRFTGGTLQYGDNNTTDYSARIQNSSSAIAIDTNSQTVNFASGLAASNTGGLTKSGSGTLTLSGVNALSGAMTVSGGILNWNGSNSSNMSNLTINGGSSLNIGSGGSLAFTGSQIFLGRGATGYLVVDGGSVSFSNVQDIANRSGTAGVTINSGTYTSTNTTYVAQTTAVGGGARSTSGSFNVMGGSTNLTTLVLGGNNTNNNELEVFNANLTVSDAGSLTTANAIQVGRGNRVTAVANISGGTVNTPGFILLPDNNGNAGASAALNVSGGVVSIGASGISRVSTDVTATTSINLSGGTLAASANWSSALDMTLSNTDGGITFKAANANNDAHNIALSGILSGDGSLTKTGAGTLTLSGANTFSGGSVINEGTLITGTSGTLGLGNVTIGSGATLQLGNFSSINDLSAVTFFGTSSFVLGYTGTENIYSLFNAETLTYAVAGTYTATELNTIFGGNVFSGTGSLLVVVPEPEVWSLLIVGGVIFIAALRRSRNRANA